MQTSGMQGSTPGATSTAEYAQRLADEAGSTASRLADAAQERFGRAQEVASDLAGRLKERGRDLLDLQGPALDAARSYVREHPVAAIGIAIVIGLLISRLTSRR